jgi:hypothetical protein
MICYLCIRNNTLKNNTLKLFALLMAGLTSLTLAPTQSHNEFESKLQNAKQQISAGYITNLGEFRTLLLGQLNGPVSLGLVVPSNSPDIEKYRQIMLDYEMLHNEPMDQAILSLMPGIYMDTFRIESSPSLLLFVKDGIIEVNVARIGTYSSIINNIRNLIDGKLTINDFIATLSEVQQDGNKQFTFVTSYSNLDELKASIAG